MSQEVGRSWRTYAKHELMNSMLGQEVGAVQHMRGLRRHSWIDLTAGDAAPVDGCAWHLSCSPGILAYHAIQSPVPAVVVLHEIQTATYDRLLRNLGTHLPPLGFHRTDENVWRYGNRVALLAINASGSDADTRWLRRGDAVFVLNDPNAITEWAMRDSFPQEIQAKGIWAHRTLSTLGCNPAGLKRLNIEERLLWYGSVNSQQSANPRHRDMLLAAIERDDSQWAYLLCTAEKWRSSSEKVFSTAFNRVGRTVAMAWARKDQADFDALKDVLFLTAKERGGSAA